MEIQKYKKFLETFEATQERIENAQKALRLFSQDNKYRQYLKVTIEIRQGKCYPNRVEIDVNAAGIEGALRNALAKEQHRLRPMQEKLEAMAL